MKKSILAIALLSLAACSNTMTKAPMEQGVVTSMPAKASIVNSDPDHSSEHALDWHGTYRGTLPCADCEGIKTSIILKSNYTFVKYEKYVGKKGKTFKSHGKIQWKGNHIVLTDEVGDSQSYEMREGSIAMLNMDNKLNTGPLADKYVLDKVEKHHK